MQSTETTALLPEKIAVMVLPQAALFPHAQIPLYIFEQQYRAMVADALDENRMFALGMEREDSSDEDENFEEIGGIGLIRACVRNEDGSSNLVLQGLCRVRFVGEVERLPYRSCGIEPMPAECLDPAGAKRWLKRLRNSGNQLADKQPDLFKAIGNVATMDASPEIIAEIAAAALPLGRPLSFKLLAEPVVEKRLEWLARIAEALLENIDDS